MRSFGFLFLIGSAMELTTLFGRFDDLHLSDWSEVFSQLSRENDDYEIDS